VIWGGGKKGRGQNADGLNQRGGRGRGEVKLQSPPEKREEEVEGNDSLPYFPPLSSTKKKRRKADLPIFPFLGKRGRGKEKIRSLSTPFYLKGGNKRRGGKYPSSRSFSVPCSSNKREKGGEQLAASASAQDAQPADPGEREKRKKKKEGRGAQDRVPATRFRLHEPQGGEKKKKKRKRRKKGGG